MTPPTSGIVVPNRLAWRQRCLVVLACFLARVIMYSWRIRHDLTPQGSQVDGPAIFCIWHNRLGVAVATWQTSVRKNWGAAGLAALVSASKDGAILADVLANFGIETVRGSSSRRGGQALLEAATHLERNYHLAITPDGPRGPRYQIHPGIIQLACVSGRPIIPVGSRIYTKYCFKSWDRFQLPMPFARVDLTFGKPLFVPRDATDAQLEEMRLNLEKTMSSINWD